MDYTKFELKDRKELAEVLKDKDNLFVLACKKCFKEFDLIEEPELHEFEQLAKEGFDPVFGARPLKRTIQQELENPLAHKLLAGELVPGKPILVDVTEDGLTISQATND